jgi:hypothetical protein
MPGFVVGAPPMGGQISSLGGRPSLDGRREYYYNYFWEIEYLFGQDDFSKDAALISLKDATLPTFTINKESYVPSSLEYKFAKSVSWDDIKVSWYDSTGLLAVMKEWRELVWTPETGLKMADDYKKLSVIHNFLPTGKKVNTWTLHNSWPSLIRHGELTYTSSEVKIVEVTVTYDWAEEEAGE